jgi:hypothetical protein
MSHVPEVNPAVDFLLRHRLAQALGAGTGGRMFVTGSQCFLDLSFI